jgi:hypothetical protein
MAPSSEEVKSLLLKSIAVLREDIARAKHWIVDAPGTNTNGMAIKWLKQQGFEDSYKIDLEATDHMDCINVAARSFSLRLAFYQACWELINFGLLVPANCFASWSTTLGTTTSHHDQPLTRHDQPGAGTQLHGGRILGRSGPPDGRTASARTSADPQDG